VLLKLEDAVGSDGDNKTGRRSSKSSIEEERTSHTTTYVGQGCKHRERSTGGYDAEPCLTEFRRSGFDEEKTKRLQWENGTQSQRGRRKRDTIILLNKTKTECM